jgi:ferrochelatase
MVTAEKTPIGVLLMSFGSAASAEEVPGYLARVRGGRPAPDELVQEFQRRYQLIGGSPLVRITAEQATALEALLNQKTTSGERYLVKIGMRFAPPSVGDGLRALADAGARRIVCVIMSPQYSPTFMGGYHKAVEEARPSLPAGTQVTVAGPWHDERRFIEALAVRVREALATLPPEERTTVPVIMTVHSLPRNMVEQEPSYLEQLRQTAKAVAEQAGLPSNQWLQAYQSAGHSQEEWLTPDFKDLLPGMRAQGHRNVVVVPVQFLADHLETLYDVDTAGRAEAEEAGMGFIRAGAPNTMPEFIEALAAVVERELRAAAARKG